MEKIKVNLNNLDKYFVKSELIPAIVYEADTKTVLEKLWRQDTHGSGAVQGRNCGIKAQHQVICKK